MEKLLTAGQVAEILNVSTAWVYEHAERKRPCYRYGSGMRTCASRSARKGLYAREALHD